MDARRARIVQAQLVSRGFSQEQARSAVRLGPEAMAALIAGGPPSSDMQLAQQLQREEDRADNHNPMSRDDLAFAHQLQEEENRAEDRIPNTRGDSAFAHQLQQEEKDESFVRQLQREENQIPALAIRDSELAKE